MTALWKRWQTKKPPKRDRREAWQDVARSVGGAFSPGKKSGTDTVALEHGPWTIVLDTHTVHTGETYVTYTRAKALFLGHVDTRLVIRKRYFFDTILENIGFGGVDPGNRTFAEKYVVKGRPEPRLRSLLSAGLIAAVLAEPHVTVTVTKASRKLRKIHGPLVRVASAYTTGVITETSRLVGLIAVAKETLTGLEAAGMATRGAGLPE